MKTGRNDPCPCGSGKKYKHCCLDSNVIPFPAAGDLNPDEFARMSGFGSAAELDEDMARYSQYCEALPDNAPIPSMMEFLGRANPASGVLNNLQSEIAGKDFGSIEELNAFFGAQVDKHNNQANDDFLGLSSGQIHNLLCYDAGEEKNQEVLSLNRNISNSEIEDTPVIIRTKAFFNEFIEAVGVDGTLPLTATGRLKPAFCKSYFEKITGLDRSKSHISKADDYPALQIITGLLSECGYLSLKKTLCRLTPKAMAQLSSDDWSGVYIDLLLCFIYKFNWIDLINDETPEDFLTFQSNVFFSLYILKQRGDGSLDKYGIYQYFYNALLKNFFNDDDYTMQMTGFIYGFLVLDYFCSQFGLIEKKYMPELHIISSYDPKIKTTALFKELLKWKV